LCYLTILGQNNAQKYASLLHCRTVQKYRLKRRDKVAAQSTEVYHVIACHFFHVNNPINDTLIVSLLLFMTFARRVFCNRYDGTWISKTKSQNTIKWRNGGIINTLFDGLTYNTGGHLLVLFLAPTGLGKILRNSENIRAYYMLNHRIRWIFIMNLHKIIIITTLYTTIKINTILSSKSEKPFWT